MKSIKKVLLIVNLIVSCFVYAENDKVQIHVESTVITNLNGTAVFNGTIKAIDSLTMLSDFSFQLDFLDSVIVTQTGGG